jgi:hypothetical protein
MAKRAVDRTRQHEMKRPSIAYAITGEANYKDLAYRFSHKMFFDPLAAGADKLDRNHANTLTAC